MATFDIVIIVVILLSAVIGLVRGLVKEILSLAGWVAAFVAAIYFSGQVSGLLPASWGSASLRLVIAFVLLFIVALILAGIVQWLVGQLISSTGLTGTDRFLGFLFGSARGLLISVVVLIGLREIAGDADWWRVARLPPELLAFEDEVRELVGQARQIVSEVPGQGALQLE